MENKKVQIVNMANGRVGINIPELHFKRVWEKRDAKINVDLDILKEIIYDTGVRNMFEQGILYIEDMEVKKELGLEPEDAKTPTNIIKLDEAFLKRLANFMPAREFEAQMATLTYEQKHQVAEYMIANECSDFNKADIIQKLIGIDVVSAIKLNRAAAAD